MKPHLLVLSLAVFSLQAASTDWLLDPSPYRARVTPSPDGHEVTLDNGLVRRVIRLNPNAATTAYDNLVTGESIIRSVRPEARVELDGVNYDVGGLAGQPVHNYLDAAWVDSLEAESGAFRFTRFKAGKTEERFPWKKRREWMPQDLPWPPPGVSLVLEFVRTCNVGAGARCVWRGIDARSGSAFSAAARCCARGGSLGRPQQRARSR